jgi:hypothetical protein
MTKKKSGGSIPAKTKRVAKAKAMRPKRAIAKRPSRAVAMTTVEPEKVKTKRVRNFKRHVKQVIAEKFPEIVLKLATESINGSLSHTKYLFQMGGVLEEIQRQEENKNEPNFVDLLLSEVRRRQEEAATTLNGTPATLQLSDGADEIDETSGNIVEREGEDAIAE